jgi:hypothetical protein
MPLSLPHLQKHCEKVVVLQLVMGEIVVQQVLMLQVVGEVVVLQLVVREIVIQQVVMLQVVVEEAVVLQIVVGEIVIIKCLSTIASFRSFTGERKRGLSAQTGLLGWFSRGHELRVEHRGPCVAYVKFQKYGP